MKRHRRPYVPHAPRPARAPRLFAEPDSSADAAQGAYIAQIDGASRGNPGPASYAVMIRRPNGQVMDELKKAIGQATNNVAEYYALIAALDYAQAHRITKLRVRSDSELLVKQIQGHYRVKSPSLRQLNERARRLAAGLAYFTIEHVPREMNREADALANAALDGAGEGAESRIAREAAAETARVESQKSRVETRRIRAHYRQGALYPAEPLELAEGAEVEVTIHKPHHN